MAAETQVDYRPQGAWIRAELTDALVAANAETVRVKPRLSRSFRHR